MATDNKMIVRHLYKSTFVFYFYIINDHNLSCLEQHIFIISQFPWVKSLGAAQLGPLTAYCLTKQQSRCQLGCILIQWLDWERLHFKKSFRLLAELISLQLHEDTSFWLALARVPHQGPRSCPQFLHRCSFPVWLLTSLSQQDESFISRRAKSSLKNS